MPAPWSGTSAFASVGSLAGTPALQSGPWVSGVGSGSYDDGGVAAERGALGDAVGSQAAVPGSGRADRGGASGAQPGTGDTGRAGYRQDRAAGVCGRDG